MAITKSSVIGKILEVLQKQIEEVRKTLPGGGVVPGGSGVPEAVLAGIAGGAVAGLNNLEEEEEEEEEEEGEASSENLIIGVTGGTGEEPADENDGKLTPGMDSKSKVKVSEESSRKKPSGNPITSSQKPFAPKNVAPGAGGISGLGGVKPANANSDRLKGLSSGRPKTPLSPSEQKQLEAYNRQDNETAAAQIQADLKTDEAEKNARLNEASGQNVVDGKRLAAQGKVDPKLIEAQRRADLSRKEAQGRAPNFDKLENDRLSQEQQLDREKPLSQQKGAFERLTKADRLRSVAASDPAQSGGLNRKANSLDSNFAKFNSSPRIRALKARNNATDSLDRRYDQIGTLQKKNAKSANLASRANSSSSNLTTAQKSGVGIATTSAASKRNGSINLLQKKNENTKNIASLADKYLTKTALKSKPAGAAEVAGQLVKMLVKNAIRAASPVTALIMGFVLLFVMISGVIYIYCFKVEPVRSTLELAQAPLSFVQDPVNATKDILTLNIPRSQIRKILEDSGVCKSINPNYCSETGKLNGDGSTDTGIGVGNISCLAAPRSGDLADPFLRAFMRGLKQAENQGSYAVSNGCVGAYQFCSEGIYDSVRGKPDGLGGTFPNDPTLMTPAQQDRAFIVAWNFDSSFRSPGFDIASLRNILQTQGIDAALARANQGASATAEDKITRNGFCGTWTPLCSASIDPVQGKQSLIKKVYNTVLAEEQAGKCGAGSAVTPPPIAKSKNIKFEPLAFFKSVEVSAQVSPDGRELVVDGVPAGKAYQATGSLAGVSPDSTGGGIDFTITLTNDYNSGDTGSKGAPIIAHLEGEVTYVVNDRNGATSGFGNEVAVYYPSIGLTAIYSHMDSVAVKVGDKVSPGSFLGGQGSTGSTRPANFNHISLNLMKGKVSGQGGQSTDIIGLYDPFLRNMMTYYASNLEKIKSKDYSPTAPGSGSGNEECNPCPADTTTTPATTEKTVDPKITSPLTKLKLLANGINVNAQTRTLTLTIGGVVKKLNADQLQNIAKSENTKPNPLNIFGSLEVNAQAAKQPRDFINRGGAKNSISYYNNGRFTEGDENSGGVDVTLKLDGFNSTGTPIVSPYSGEVTYFENRGSATTSTTSYGTEVAIYYPNLDATVFYAHLDSLPPGIKVGDRIEPGSLIGFQGKSGSVRSILALTDITIVKGKVGRTRGAINWRDPIYNKLFGDILSYYAQNEEKIKAKNFSPTAPASGSSGTGGADCVTSNTSTNPGKLGEAKDPGTEFSKLSAGNKAFLEYIAKQKGYIGPFPDNGGPDAKAKVAMDKLIARAKADGINLQIAGDAGSYGYRGYNLQTSIFLEKIPANLQYQDSMGAPDKVPKNVIDAYLDRAKLSAPPGYSEHHTGKAADFVSDNAASLNLDPGTYPASLATWLEQNAPKEGFKLTYPKGSTQGAGYEPWHWFYGG